MAHIISRTATAASKIQSKLPSAAESKGELSAQLTREDPASLPTRSSTPDSATQKTDQYSESTHQRFVFTDPVAFRYFSSAANSLQVR